MPAPARRARPLSRVAFACTLPLALAAGASEPGAVDLRSKFSCNQAVVLVAVSQSETSPPKVTRVDCRRGSFRGILAASDEISPGKPALILLEQGTFFGPDCKITVSRGGTTAVLAVQQNFCAAKAGMITASVASGPATLQGTAVGSFFDKLPGYVWYRVDF